MVFGADTLALLIRCSRAHPLAVLITFLGGHELRAVNLAAGVRLWEHGLRREERCEHGDGNHFYFHCIVLSSRLRL
jgi:surfactin synthase thioesterase subunit